MLNALKVQSGLKVQISAKFPEKNQEK